MPIDSIEASRVMEEYINLSEKDDVYDWAKEITTEQALEWSKSIYWWSMERTANDMHLLDNSEYP